MKQTTWIRGNQAGRHFTAPVAVPLRAVVPGPRSAPVAVPLWAVVPGFVQMHTDPFGRLGCSQQHPACGSSEINLCMAPALSSANPRLCWVHASVKKGYFFFPKREPNPQTRVLCNGRRCHCRLSIVQDRALDSSSVTADS